MTLMTIHVSGEGHPSRSLTLPYSGPHVKSFCAERGELQEIIVRSGTWMGLLFKDDVSPGEALKIELEPHEGDPCHPVPKCAEARLVYPAFRLPPMYPHTVVEPIQGLVEEQTDRSSSELHLHNLTMESMNRCLPLNEEDRAPWMFWHLDSQTARPLFADELLVYPPDIGRMTKQDACVRKWIVQEVLGQLSTRMRARWGTAAQPNDLPKAPPFALIAYLSAIMRTIIQSWFCGPRLTDNDYDFAEAFARFASGRMALRRVTLKGGPTEHHFVSDGGPNGSAVVLFAEFALTAIELNIDREFWTQVAPAFVYSLPIFQQAFGTPGTPLPSSSYDKNRELPPKHVPDRMMADVLRTIRHTCRDLPELADAFRDQLQHLFSQIGGAAYMETKDLERGQPHSLA